MTTYRFAACLMLVVVSNPAMADEPVDSAVARVGKLLREPPPEPRSDRVQTARTVFEILAPVARGDDDLETIVGMLGLSLDRERFAANSLSAAIATVQSAEPEERATTLDALEIGLLDRLEHLVHGLGRAKPSPEMIAVLDDLVGLVRDRARSLDDVERERFRGTVARLRDLADGLPADSALAEEIASLASLLPTGRWPAAPYAVPLSVFVPVQQHQATALREAAGVVQGVSDAIEGRPGAIANLGNAVQRFEDRFFGRHYARAIWDAVDEKLSNRYSFASVLAEWLGFVPNREQLAKWTGRWDTRWGNLEIDRDGKVTPFGTGFFARRGGRVFIRHADGDTVGGTWDFPDYGLKGTFEWTLRSPNQFTGYRCEVATRLAWGAFRLPVE